MDDGLQIIEQIVPFFQPSLSVNIKYLEGFQSDSVPIILDSVTPTHDEDLDADTDRNFLWILTFRMKVNFHTPKRLTGRIQDVIMNLHPNEKGADNDQLTQFQLNALKLDNINDLTGYYALVFNRVSKLIDTYKRGDESLITFNEEFQNTEYELHLIKSEGDFDYDESEFYMTDLAGTTTYTVNADFNVITFQTTFAAAAVGAPQVVEFIESTTDSTFMMAISDTGELQISQ